MPHSKLEALLDAMESDSKIEVAKPNQHLSKRMPFILTMCQNVISSIFVKAHISRTEDITEKWQILSCGRDSHSYKFKQTTEYGNVSASNETTCCDPLFER